ncbi:hypothetical protein A2U01_0099100, partial [Trifolium medium]|nr:hypothetical protein [Trifolium medium]
MKPNRKSSDPISEKRIWFLLTETSNHRRLKNPNPPTRRRTAKIRQDTESSPTTQRTGCSTT